MARTRDFLSGGDTADPRNLQRRYQTTPSGRGVWIDLTGDDRLKCIRQLPHRWPEVMIARERGETLDQIATWAKVPTPCKPRCGFTKANIVGGVLIDEGGDHIGPACLAYLVSECYAKLETMLDEIAQKRARLLP